MVYVDLVAFTDSFNRLRGRLPHLSQQRSARWVLLRVLEFLRCGLARLMLSLGYLKVKTKSFERCRKVAVIQEKGDGLGQASGQSHSSPMGKFRDQISYPLPR